MNCFPWLGLLQARLRRTSMATLALQHQHHQFGSSPKSSSTFDNWATSFYSTGSPSSRIRRPKLLHQKQMYDCSSQGEKSPYCSWPSKRLALQNNFLQRTATHSSFRRKATELSTILPEELSHRQVVNLFPSPPWLASSFCTNQVSSTIPGICGCDDPPTLNLEKSLEHILSYQVDYTIYTDGSAYAGIRNGGGAAIISTGSPTQPTLVSTIKIKGRAFTDSYEEEIAAMEAALQWTYTNANWVQTSILICMDSQSLCEALSSCNP